MAVQTGIGGNVLWSGIKAPEGGKKIFERERKGGAKPNQKENERPPDCVMASPQVPGDSSV